MEKTKVTAAQILTVIKAITAAQVQDEELMDGVYAEDIINYCDKTLEQMARKAEKAKERRSQKAIEGDELKEQIFELVSETPQTRDEINEALGLEEVSVHKCGSRLSQLVKEGRILKDKRKIEKAEKTVYFLPTEAE